MTKQLEGILDFSIGEAFCYFYNVAKRDLRRQTLKMINVGGFENYVDGINRNAHWRDKVKFIRSLDDKARRDKMNNPPTAEQGITVALIKKMRDRDPFAWNLGILIDSVLPLDEEEDD